MTFHTAFAMAEMSQVGEARRAAIRMAEGLNLPPAKSGAVGIVVTELATNVVRYAIGGQLLIRASEPSGLEVLALDRGPGFDVTRCMQDGYSTGGTPGNGLGAVRRMSDEFDVYSNKDFGTAVFARIGPTPTTGSRRLPFEWGAVSLAMPGESVCGDACDVFISDSELRIIVADGLGHGPEASRAAQTAIEQFKRHRSTSPKMLIEEAHRAMSATRGAAIAAGHLSLSSEMLTYAGIGNISGSLVTHGESRGLMSHNGTVGANMRSVQQLDYAWLAGWMLVMHSDGIQTRWDLSKYPGIFSCHVAILAGVLARDFNRGRDDATVVVVRRL